VSGYELDDQDLTRGTGRFFLRANVQ